MKASENSIPLPGIATREEWEDSPAGWPQTPLYQWWRLHDEYH
jgi:hypothetical protein